MTGQIKAHRELYTYYILGGKDQDEEYFGSGLAEAEKNALLWASFMALVRYNDDVTRICAAFF